MPNHSIFFFPDLRFYSNSNFPLDQQVLKCQTTGRYELQKPICTQGIMQDTV